MHMKRQWVFSLLILLLLPGLCGAVTNASNVPSNVTLTVTETTITVKWTGDSQANGYYVYWGTTSTDLANKIPLTGSLTTTTTISSLTPGTTYYVAVSSYNRNSVESSRSTVQSATTIVDITKPATPTGFGVTSISSITENSVTLKWNRNTESDLDHYSIYYDITSGSTGNVLTAHDADASSFTVSSLAASTRYYFAISASDIAGNESDKSKELIIDTLPDTLPPNAPAKISGYLSDLHSITITIDNGNAQMADFKGNILFYGATSGNLDQQVDLGDGFTYTLTDLAENSTLYFSALSYDYSGNKSERTAEASATVEKTERYLNKPSDFDGGCFIHSAAAGSQITVSWGFLFVLFIAVMGKMLFHRKRFIIMMLSCLLTVSFAGYSAAGTTENMGANIAGVFAGWYLPSDSKFEDFYGNDVLQLSAFYERQLNGWVSMDVESGFMKEKGHLLTEAGAKTGVGTDLTLAPVAASVNVYRELMPYLVGYIGAGPDYWYCREKTARPAVFPKIEEWVGGCHGKAGVKLYNTDEKYKNTGAILETTYSWIARFGGNNTDLGGWAFKFGLFYQF